MLHYQVFSDQNKNRVDLDTRLISRIFRFRGDFCKKRLGLWTSYLLRIGDRCLYADQNSSRRPVCHRVNRCKACEPCHICCRSLSVPCGQLQRFLGFKRLGTVRSTPLRASRRSPLDTCVFARPLKQLDRSQIGLHTYMLPSLQEHI